MILTGFDQVHEGAVTEELVSKFRVVVLTDNRSREELVRLAEACHRAGVAVIAADTWGVFGWCFVDMGANHVISDRTGERPKVFFFVLKFVCSRVCSDRLSGEFSARQERRSLRLHRSP